MSKAIILAAVPLSYARFLSLVKTYFEKDDPGKFYAYGNCVGIAQMALAMNFRNLKYKVFLVLALVIVDIAANLDGFSNFVNLVGIFCVASFTVSSFVYQEILLRQDYKEIYVTQEKLQKFKSLLSDDFPIPVLVMSANNLSGLYSNQSFKKTFGQDEEKVREEIFPQFEIEIDPTNLGFSKSEQAISFYDFISNLSTQKLVVGENNMVVLPAIYRQYNSEGIEIEQVSHYEIKIRETTWDQLPAYAIIFNDVSEKQLVTALKIADEQKDRIIATVSHELRTPINGTLGLLDMISVRVSDTISQTYINYCKNCNQLLLYLVNSILDLSRINQNHLQIIKENFVLDDLLEELQSLYLYTCQDKKIQFKIEKGPKVPKVLNTDKHRLIQILINLVGNAIKFTFQGSVTLKIEIDRTDPAKLRFSVVDTGIGIKEEDQPKLFQRFGKLQQPNSNINVQGVGLGLAIVQELVKVLNDGDDIQEKVQVHSEYEKGSVFSFCVPFREQKKNLLMVKNGSGSKFFSKRNLLAKGSESPIFPKEFDHHRDSVEEKFKKYETSTFSNYSNHILLSPASSSIEFFKETREIPTLRKKSEVSGTLKNVLIVDDNPFNILAASFVLEKLQCSIDKAFHGEECLSLLKNNTEKSKYYDLILMDIQMPIMDGPQASRIISEKVRSGELKKVPIIALTAKKSTEKEEEYYKNCGIEAVLEKPLNSEKLINTINSLIKS